MDDVKLDEEASRKKKENSRYPTVSYALAAELEALTGQETRVTVPGHYQRGGPPCPYDRVLATQFGTAAADLIINKQYGRMVAIQNGEICSISLDDAASKTKFLPVDHPIIQGRARHRHLHGRLTRVYTTYQHYIAPSASGTSRRRL